MLEILISSSILIVVLALLRAVLHGRIPARVQYALWGLVALRLLVPVSLFSLPVSASKVAAPIKRQSVTYSSERAVTVEYPVSMGREPVTGETVTVVALDCVDETLAESYRAFCVPTAFCSFCGCCPLHGQLDGRIRCGGGACGHARRADHHHEPSGR